MKNFCRFASIIFVLFCVTTFASCAGLNQGLKDVNAGLKESLAKNPSKPYDFKLDTRLLVLRSWLPDPKPGGVITAAKSIDDDMVKIAIVTVYSPKKPDGSYQKVPADRMRGIFINEVRAVGGDGYTDYVAEEHKITGTAWAFKTRMKVPYD